MWLANGTLKIEKEAENTPNSGKAEWFLQGTLYPEGRQL
jgi:GMP synthase (glutamine-hydrolysing)